MYGLTIQPGFDGVLESVVRWVDDSHGRMAELETEAGRESTISSVLAKAPRRDVEAGLTRVVAELDAALATAIAESDRAIAAVDDAVSSKAATALAEDNMSAAESGTELNAAMVEACELRSAVASLSS